MEHKTIFLISTGIFILATISAYFLSSPSLGPELNETCNEMHFSSESSINLVFFGKEEEAEAYSNELFATSPFDKLKESFNIYYIDSEIKCEYYKEIALYCYSRNLLKRADICPNDYIFVVKEDEDKIRSSSYLNVMSINMKNPISVIAHEFGHSFANLAEEYTPAKLPKKSENCVKECKQFNNKSDGCFKGCSESNYYRSIDSGLMKTLYSSNFGTFNEFLIENKIKKTSKTTITGNAIQSQDSCENQLYYLILADYSSGKLTIKDKQIEQGCAGANGEGSFSYSVLDKYDNLIESSSFNPELIFTDSQTQEQDEISGETYNYEGELYLRVPAPSQAQTLEIYDQEQKIASLQIDNIEGRPCKIE